LIRIVMWQKYARIAGLVLLAAELHGATITWTNTSGGIWSAPANWSTHVVPGVLDTAVITMAGTYTVTVDTTVGIHGLILGGASGQQTFSNGGQAVGITNTFVGANGIISLSGSGTMNGGLMTNQGTFNWSGGTLSMPMTNAASGTLNINGTSVNLYSPLTNAGTIHVSGSGPLFLYNNQGVYQGAVYNQAGGLFDLQVDQGVANGGFGFEVFVNAGTLQKSSGVATSTIGVAYTNSNSGLVDAESGTVSFSVGGNIGGAYNTAAGAVIQFTGGTFNETGSVSVTGSGLCQQNGATVILNDRISQFVLASGNVVLSPTFEGTGTIQSLQLSGATLTGTNTVTGTLGISGGALGPGSVLTVKAGGTLDFNGGAANIFGPLTNAGTIIWTGNNVFVGNNGSSDTGVIANQPSGLFLIQSDQSLAAGGFGRPEVFLNAGTVRKTAGLGITTFTVGFTNTGVVDGESGTIQFQSGGNIGGNYNTASGAVIQFTGGSFVQAGAASVTGSGVCRQNGGGANFTLTDFIANLLLNSGNVALSPTFQTNGTIHNLELDGATLTGSNVVTGTLTMNGGAMGPSSPLTVSNGAVLNVIGSSMNVYSPLTNAGTINWTGGNIFVGNNGSSDTGVIANQSGGFFFIQCDQSLNGSGFGAPEVYLNAGTLRKTAGVGTTILGVGFTNSGVVDAESGIIQFQAGGNIGGSYNAASGALIQFNGGTFVQSGAPTVTGAGLCRQNGATVRLSDRIANLSLVSGNVVLSPTFQVDGAIHNLQLDGATLIGTNVVAGSLTMNGSAMGQASPLTIAGGGVMNLGGGGLNVYSPLTNNGTINWAGGNIFIGNNGSSDTGVVNNQPGGLFLVQSDQGVFGAGFGAPEFFLNSGTFRKTAGIATTSISAAFTNSGTLDAQSGIIHFGGVYAQIGGTMNFGITSLAEFGQITFSASAPLTGTVSANLTPEYSPSAGDSFPLVTYTSHSGVFTSVSLPPQAVWQTNYSGTTFTISVLSVVTNLPSIITLKSISLAAGQFTLQVNGSVGPVYVVEASSNMLNWTGVSTSTPAAMPFDVVDTNAGAFARRFYRARIGP
jgi:hypothetical protein